MAAMPPAGANFGVGSWIERRARIAPDQVALVGEDRSFTYAELARRIRRLANGLRRLGVGRGDRVAWLGPNHPAFLESLFASGLVGAALAPVNHRLAADGIRAVLGDIEPRVLIQHAATEPTPAPASVRHRVAVAGSVDGALGLEVLVTEAPEDPVQVSVAMEDVCLLPHTSGTTGAPKGVMLTHANLTWNVVNFLTCADFRGDDVTVAIAPFFRVGGTGVNVLPVLFMGGTVVVPSDLRPEGILRAMERHRVTVGFGNPDLLDGLARCEVWPQVDLSSVRFVVTGGAPVPERLIRAWLDRGVLLLQGYGLSEAGPLALLLDHDSALTRVGSAGRPPLLVDIQIVHPDGWGWGRPASCWCGAPTSWPGTGGGPRPPRRSCRRTAGWRPVMRRAATRRGTSGSSIGWRPASSPVAGTCIPATSSGCCPPIRRWPTSAWCKFWAKGTAVWWLPWWCCRLGRRRPNRRSWRSAGNAWPPTRRLPR
jgi:acyl-CoA synthetase (AMP-forming)/AMP-acid ligase II